MTGDSCCERGWVVLRWWPSAVVEPCPEHLAEQHARWVADAHRPKPWEWFAEVDELDA